MDRFMKIVNLFKRIIRNLRHSESFKLYKVLRFFVVVAMIMSFLRGNYENFFFCILTLLLFLLPSFGSLYACPFANIVPE